MYEFRVAAVNNLGAGMDAVKEIQMPEGGEMFEITT